MALRSRFRRLWLHARYSFWLVPAVLVVSAVLLAAALIRADTSLAPDAFARWPRLFGAGAEGARGLLSTVATSMITLAGVVFSITLVALSLASSQYSPRVLRNFMSDRVNQVVLGVFVGIFAYSLVVLRTIRGGDEGTFVPTLAVSVGLLLGFVGIGVLVHFIHHISTSIQASRILAAAAHETLRAVEGLFPEGELEAEPDAGDFAGERSPHARPLLADRSGYLQSLDRDGLVAFARQRGAVVRMRRGIGEFVVAGRPLAAIVRNRPAAGAGEGGDDERRAFDGLHEIGRQRTIEQDAAFGVRQIVDVALKALSPSVNDTTTAVMALHHLTGILVALAGRRLECQLRDEDGELRLVTCGPTYAGMVGEALDQIRQNAAGNVAVHGALLDALRVAGGATASPARREALREHARAVAESAERTVPAPRDRRHLDELARRTLASLDPLGPPEDRR